jgi:hypothetical protein
LGEDDLSSVFSRRILSRLTLAAVFMFLLAPQLIHRWLGNSIHVDTVLLAGLACWAVVDSVGNSIAMFLNVC